MNTDPQMMLDPHSRGIAYWTDGPQVVRLWVRQPPKMHPLCVVDWRPMGSAPMRPVWSGLTLKQARRYYRAMVAECGGAA